MNQTTSDPIQDLLATARRNQILDAATKVFAEKGFHRATIRDVARVAGIADGTIYNYFENKNALLLGLLDRLNQTDQRQQHFEHGATMGLEDFVRFYLRQRLATFSELGLDVFQILMSELLVNQELRQAYFRKVVGPTFAVAEQTQAVWLERHLRPSLDPKLTLRAISSIVMGTLILRILGDPYLEAEWDNIPAVLAELILHGIVTDNGDNMDIDKFSGL
jgi:AcrR family transcriptional regulator